MCVFAAMLIALAFSDLEKRILPDQFTKGGIGIGLIFSAFVPVPDVTSQALLWFAGLDVQGWPQSVLESAIGAFLPAFFLWFGGWVFEKGAASRRARPGRRSSWSAWSGSFLGLQGALFTLIVGSIAASIVGLAYIKATGQDASKYELPFGTFLCLAALGAAMGGQRLLGLVRGLIIIVNHSP